MKTLSIIAALLLAAPAVRADDEAAKPAEAAPEEKPAATDKADAKLPGKKAKAGGGDDRAYVDAALAFLKGLAHSARKGEQGEAGWAAVKENAGDKVSVKIAGAAHDVDVAGKKSDVRLLKFQKISTWREGSAIKGVTADVLEFKVGKETHAGKGRVGMEDKDGKWVVTSVEVD